MDRRKVIQGALASVMFPNIAQDASVTSQDKLFSSTSLSDNRVAQSFERVDIRLPGSTVVGRSGKESIRSAAKGPCLLMLWSERCTPCLWAARDLAVVRQRLVGNSFSILSLLTNSVERLGYVGAEDLLSKAGASGLPLFIEPYGIHDVAVAVTADWVRSLSAWQQSARKGDASIVLPCTLLIHRDGRVRGRAMGLLMAQDEPNTFYGQSPVEPHHRTDTSEKRMVMAANKTAWATPDGAEFLVALRQGLMEEV